MARQRHAISSTVRSRAEAESQVLNGSSTRENSPEDEYKFGRAKCIDIYGYYYNYNSNRAVVLEARIIALVPRCWQLKIVKTTELPHKITQALEIRRDARR